MARLAQIVLVAALMSVAAAINDKVGTGMEASRLRCGWMPSLITSSRDSLCRYPLTHRESYISMILRLIRQVATCKSRQPGTAESKDCWHISPDAAAPFHPQVVDRSRDVLVRFDKEYRELLVSHPGRPGQPNGRWEFIIHLTLICNTTQHDATPSPQPGGMNMMPSRSWAQQLVAVILLSWLWVCRSVIARHTPSIPSWR